MTASARETMAVQGCLDVPEADPGQVGLVAGLEDLHVVRKAAGLRAQLVRALDRRQDLVLCPAII